MYKYMNFIKKEESTGFSIECLLFYFIYTNLIKKFRLPIWERQFY